MRHTQYLLSGGKRSQFPAHGLGDAAPDTDVDLIENGSLIALAKLCYRFQNEHHARRLTARRDLRERTRGLARIGRKTKFASIKAICRKRAVALGRPQVDLTRRLDPDLETRLFQRNV